MKPEFSCPVLEHSPMGYVYHQVLFDQEQKPCDYIFCWVNPAFERLTGVSAGQVIGRKVSRISRGDRKQDIDWGTLLAKVTPKKREWEMEHFRDDSGSWIRIHAVQPARDYILTFLTDITRQKKREQKSSEKESILESVIQNFPNSFIYVVEKDLTISFTAGQRLASREPGRRPVKGRNVLEIGKAADRPLKKFCETTFAGKECSFELTRNSRTYRYRTVPLKNNQEPPDRILLVEEDITQKRRTDDILKAERDVSVQLNRVSRLPEALRICLDYALEVSDMDSGGVYLVTEKGGLNLSMHRGLGAGFIRSVSRYSPDSRQARLVMKGRPVYTHYRNLLPQTANEMRRREGLKGMAVLPVKLQNRVIASLNLSSHQRTRLDTHEKMALESLASRIGTTIARVKGEEALKQSEERHRILLETSIAGICIQDLKDDLIYVNRRFAGMLGYGSREMVGMNMSRLCSRDILKNQRKKTLKRKTGKSEIYESTLIRKDGEPIHILVNATPYRNHDREIIGSVGIVLDITDRKEAEENLRKSEIRYRKLFEFARDAIMTLNPPTWRFTSGNPAIIKMFKVKNEAEFIRLTPWRLSPRYQPDGQLSSKKAREMIEIAMQRGFNYFEWDHRRLNGEVFPATVALTRVELKEGNFLQATVRDISREKRVEKALRESEELYRNLYETSLAALWRTRRSDGKFLKANLTTAKLMGFQSVEELLQYGKSADLYQDPEDRKRLLQELEEHGEVHEFECPFIMRGGQKRYLLISARDYPEKGFLEGVIKDITEQKTLETQRAELEEQYQQSQKMESIGRLAGGVAHDLNNLLSPIIGYSDLLLRDYPLEGKKSGYLRQVRKAGLRARDLVRQLLAFGRKQNLEFKTVNLNTVIRNFERLLSRTIRQNIQIRLSLFSKLPKIWADIGQLEQVIMNLAVNAQDAMPQGGTLRLETRTVRLDENYARLHPEVIPGEYVMLAITDSGYGIEKENLEKIFEPFFTTKETGKGTGLGLSTVYGIIKQHRANISVASKINGGTTFTLYFPVTDTYRRPRKPGKGGNINLKGSETILLAEDNQHVRTLALDILKMHGYRVWEAKNGNDALALLRSCDEPVNLLLTDVMMPDMNGYDLYRRARRENPEMKVLYMSGYTRAVITHHVKTEDYGAFIQKPFTPRILATRVRQVLDNEIAQDN